MAACKERIILQSDWDEALREDNGRSWVMFKKGGVEEPGVHGELSTQGISQSGLPYVTVTPGFNISSITKKSVVVSYQHEGLTLSRKFVAPLRTFYAIHQPKKTVNCLDVTTGGLGISADSELNLRIWQTDTGEVRRELKGHMGEVTTCKFFPSGIVALSSGMDMLVKIWSAETGECAATLAGHTQTVLDTAVVEKGRNIVTCGNDGTAKLWDVGKQACLYTFAEVGGPLNACALAPINNSIDLGAPGIPPTDREVLTEGKMLLLACENATLQGFGLQSRKKVFELQCQDAVNCCCFLSDVQAVCGTQGGHITVVDIRNIRVPVKEWKELRSAILSLLPYKQGFFVGTGDGSCFLVDELMETPVELTGAEIDPVKKMACDGSHLYTCCRDGAIRVYNLAIV